jgi:type III secretory pathway lipoprotein EscJ
MVAVTVALIGFFAFVIMRVTSPQMTTLFTDLSTEDSSGIVKDLERQAIPYELRNDGAVIMVPKDKVTRLRMNLAEAGLPKGGGVGYEIFDKSDALGTTSFVQNINHLRALEGELARTIRAIDRIQAARVHLVLPERPLFSRETPEPSASIVVRVRGALEPQQIKAIRHLVSSAVNGLKPQRVSIVDESGQLLADGATGDNENTIGDERRAGFEKRMRSEVEAIVSSVVGAGRARVQLSADFDYNKITQTSDRFDPEGRVLRSSQTREESSATAETNGQVTVNNELPGNQRGADSAAPARDQSKKTEETNNYEISHTTKTEVTEAGRVNRISVAVLVDGTYAKNDKGEMVYRNTGALGDRLRPETRRSGRGRQPQIRGSPGGRADRRADGISRHAAVHQGRRDVRHRTWRDDAARSGGDVHGGPAAGQAHHRFRSDVLARGRPDAGADRWQRGTRRYRPESGAQSQRHQPDDRRGPGPGPGSRPVGASRRRARGAEPERNRVHHSSMALGTGVI